MNNIGTTNSWHQVRYTIAGFDRPSFISDIAEAIPQDDSCQIARLDFVGDGIQARVWLMIRVQGQQRSSTIHDRLRAVRGMVSVQTDPNQWATA